MKRYLMVFLAVLLFSTATSAQTKGYICLFSEIEHTTWCSTAATIPGALTIYVFCLPSVDGAFGAEFKLNYPDDPTIMPSAETYNPDVTVVMGSFSNGAGIGFNECKNDWFMIASQMFITTSSNQVMISIAPHPTSGGPSLADCGPLHAKYTATAFNNLYINYPPGSPECSETATAEITWGAIKSMYID